MVELFLDNKEAVLRDNISIKLTRENVYFTKNGSYTYDVELPLQCVENRAIFGNINRKDVEARHREFHAVLRVDGSVLLDGKALISQVTDTGVKVQLLGGNSEMNFYAKGEEVYIDELDLGDWQNELATWDFATEKGTAMFRAYLDWLDATKLRFSNSPESTNEDQAQKAYEWWRKRWWSYDDSLGYDAYENRGVAFPVINKNSEWNSYCESGLLCNEVVMRKHGNRYFPEYRLDWPNQSVPGGKFPQVCPSFQPMLCRTLRKIMRACGYPLDDVESLKLLYKSNNLFPRIFIACANNRREIAKALPHWTVNEFLTQIERFMGIVIEVDEVNHTSRILARSQWWSDVNPTIVEQVVDEYSVEIDKNETSDISNGNVGYADMTDGMAHISNEIMEVATIDTTTFSSYIQMKVYLTNGAKEEDKNKIFVVDGHQFILYSTTDERGNKSYEFKEVNQMRALKRKPDSSSIDVELKIVPAQLVPQKVRFVSTVKTGDKWYDTQVGEGEVNVIVVQDRENVGADLVNGATSQRTDLQALIEGDASVDKSSDVDKLYVGVVPDGMGTVTATQGNATLIGPYPKVYPYSRYIVNKWGLMNEDDEQSAYLTLSNVTDAHTIGNQSLNDGKVIDTTVKQCIKFVGNGPQSPTGLFIIGHKKYACEKLEYTITSRGVNKLVTGYFYRIE